MGAIDYRSTKALPTMDVVHLYEANGWSSARKPELLLRALSNSETLVSAWDSCKLVGLGNAISDGFLVVYYPHLLVLPDYRGRGVGSEILRRLRCLYKHFHQHVIIAEAGAVEFYRSEGFSRAGNTVPMWIYEGEEH